MRCPKCGTIVRDLGLGFLGRAYYCPKCGTPRKNLVPEESTPSPIDNSPPVQIVTKEVYKDKEIIQETVMQPLRYLDFDLSIRRENSHYMARVLHSPAGEASCTFTLPYSEDKIEIFVLRMSRIGRGTRSIASPEMDAAREFGGRLFDAIFSRELIGCLRSSLDEADRHEATGLRFKLRLQEAPELARLPWEFLFDRELARFFAQSNRTPIVRYLEMPERITPLAIDLPLRILAMISSPEDPRYPPLNLEREKAKLQKSLGQLTSQGKVEVDWLEVPTLAALQRRLRTDVYHVFHFMGHGGFDEKAGEGLLLLEDELRRGWPAEASRIGTILHDHRSLRLAVLNSCEGARTSSIDPFAGSAATLIRQGIPAVVAMQFEITDDAAITFSAEFYDALADGLPVDAAVSEARKAIFSMPNDLEWGTPVLYMRSPDGILFSIEKGPTRQKTLQASSEAPRILKPPIQTTEPEQPTTAESRPPMQKPRKKECSRCGSELPFIDARALWYDGERICQSCAATIESERQVEYAPKFCPQCGKPFRKNSKFCLECGAPIKRQLH